MTTTELSLVEEFDRTDGKAEIIDGMIENDYGPAAGRDMTARRVDDFAAGPLVVWDADLFNEEVARVYHQGDAEQSAAVYRRGQFAEAETTVPGWTMLTDDLFAA